MLHGPTWLTGWALCAVAGALTCIPPVAAVARRLGLVDHPGEARRIHRNPTPRSGGLAVFGVVTLVLLGALATAPAARWADRNLIVALLGGGGILVAVGAWDDRRGVPPRAKILAQVAAALVALGAGFDPWHGLGSVPLLEGALFMVWVLAITNAFNLVDGMDGLAGTVALVALMTVCAYAALLGNSAVLLPAVVLGSGVLGFLRHNIAPARVFLGDAGSLFIGFALAVLTLAGARGAHGVGEFFLPLCALAFPVLDTGTAIGRRWLRQVPVFSPDARHIHHRLLALGLGPRGVVGVVYAVSLAFAAIGTLFLFLPRQFSVALGLGGVLLLGCVVLYGADRLAYHEFGVAMRLVLTAPTKARRLIHSQIVLRDFQHDLAAARDVPTVRALLTRLAPALHLDVVLLTPDPRDVLGGPERTLVMAPVLTDPRRARREYLVIGRRCEAEGISGGAERVARALAPLLDAWFAQLRTTGVPLSISTDPVAAEVAPLEERAVVGGGAWRAAGGGRSVTLVRDHSPDVGR